jgi:ABC-type dipeptide/oligopeptide/nickel transport system permease subunit
MLSEVRQYLRGNAYLAIAPGVTICVCAMSLNLVGDGLRDALDPKMKN